MLLKLNMTQRYRWQRQNRPVESHSGARENIIAGPYPPILYVLRSRRGRKRGERCSLTIRLGVRGSVVSSPSGVAEPRPKMDSMHILGQKEAIWNTIFSIFERRLPPPPNVAGPGKTPPLDGSATKCQQLSYVPR